MLPEMEFKEFEPRFKSAKTRFKLSAGLNLITFDLNQPNLSRGLNLNRRSNSLNSATISLSRCIFINRGWDHCLDFKLGQVKSISELSHATRTG